MATLTCKQCNYVNEGERVYCHNCGSKLDRSLLPPDEIQTGSAMDAERKRVQKMMRPSRGIFAGVGKSFVGTLLWALLAAVAIEMARPPDGVPPVFTKEQLMDSQPITFALQDAMEKTVPQKLTVQQEAINKYLASTIKSKESGMVDSIKFIRSFVNCEEGVVQVATEQSVLDYSLYAISYYKVAIQDNRLAATNVGGAIGRMPIHPAIMAYGDLIFQKLWDALARERKLLDRLQAIEIHKGNVLLTTKPAVL